MGLNPECYIRGLDEKNLIFEMKVKEWEIDLGTINNELRSLNANRADVRGGEQATDASVGNI